MQISLSEIAIIFGILTGVISMVISASTVYLRLFIKGEVAELKDSLHKEIREEYVTKERMEAMETRVQKLEAKAFPS